MKRPWPLLVAVVVAGLLSGCDTSAYAFRVDESITITEPAAQSTVPLPVTIRWTDAEAPADPRVDPADPEAEYYAVFVDRSPLPPRRRLSALGDDPEACEKDPACPTKEYLRDKGVFLTAKPELTLKFLADRRASSRASSKDPHEVTIVRMRGDTRVNESAFLRPFFVQR